jgi:quinol-cytochrome oxidoreductase complex cytochrome b subunit
MRTRLRVWFQERFPLEALEGLVTRKVVPMHRHSVWYCLGGLLLFNLGVLICTGMLLVVQYQAGVSSGPGMPGSHGSVRRIVEELPHGWWIRSIHHWTANVMVMAAFVHMFSVLLMKAYRRPRELIWWTGLGVFGLVLTSAFTGYLLPWNTLSFSATRVGAGIAGALPLAGPLVRDLLLAGPDVSEATLTRFFGLHVAILPVAILSMVGMHVSLLMYHGSSVPASAKACKLPGGRLWSVRFWPEYTLHDARNWVIALAGVLTVAFLLPPAVGEQANPLSPAPEGIRPEWYFLSLFRTFKLMPDHVLGLENLKAGVVAVASVATIMVLMPILHTMPGPKPRHRLRDSLRRRLLLLVSALLGWAAMTAPLRMAAQHCWHDWFGLSAGGAANVFSVLAAIGWLAVAIILERTAERSPHGPATFFGVTLVSVVTGYTLWEGLGAATALFSLVMLHAVLVFGWATQLKAGWVIKVLVAASVVVVAASLVMVIPLGISHDLAREAAGTAMVPAPVVPAVRHAETLGRLWFGLGVCVFLLVVIQYRLSLLHRARQMGLLMQAGGREAAGRGKDPA